MQIVIEIDKDAYEALCGTGYVRSNFNIIRAVRESIPLPKHHGRLIDADELKKRAMYMDGDNVAIEGVEVVTVGMIDNAETIIPAMEEEPIKQTKKEVDCITCNFKWNCYKHGKLVNPCDAYIEQHEQTTTEEGENK